MTRRAWRARVSAAILAAGPMSAAAAADPGTAWESLGDAWWTGSLLAKSVTTLPAGRFYMEPSLDDGIPYTRFDSEGEKHDVTHENQLGLAIPVEYGVTSRMTVSATLWFGYDWIDQGQSSAGVGAGDPSVQIQYQLTQYQPGSWIPVFAVDLQETLPMGRYDRLDRQADGFGSGANTTTVAACSQTFFWMPNGRIVRARLDLIYAVSQRVWVEGQSVYGTPDDFRGHAAPGDSASADLAFEYSATSNWVVAWDFWLERDANGRVAGNYAQPGGESLDFLSVSGTGRELIVAPALEYNWSRRLGIILGGRMTVAGRNESGFVMPVVALSYLR
jgi:hypothetical protein